MNLAETRARLRSLEQRRQLEKRLVPHVGMPWGDIVSMLQYPAFVGVAVHLTRMGLHASETKAAPAVDDLVWLFVLVVVALALRYGLGGLVRGRADRLRRKVRREGLLLPAAIVQANNAFYDDGNEQWLSATVLVSFDPAVVGDPDRLERAATSLQTLRHLDRRALPPAEAELAWDLYHEMGPVVSRPVPPERAEGLRDCWMASTMLPPAPLRIGALCMALAVPGERSPHAIAILPAEVLS